MTDAPKTQGVGGIVTTGLVASSFSGAIVTLLVGYIHLRYNIDLTQPNLAQYEGALHTIVETAFTGIAMLAHIVLRRYFST